MKKPEQSPYLKRPKLSRAQAASLERVRRQLVMGRRFFMMKYVLAGLAIVAAVTAVLLTQGPSITPAEEADARFFRISTASAGGTYFPVGRTLGSIISHPPGAEPCQVGGRCGVPGLIAIAKASPGSIANVRNVNSGRVDSALAQSDIVSWAYEGERMFERDGIAINLRAIASLYSESVQVVASKDSGITRLTDLPGKRVSIGRVGSGTRADALLILDAYGIELGDMQLVEVDELEASDLIRRGELDAFFIVSGTPALAVADLIERTPVTLVPIEGEQVDALISKNRFFARDRIPADVYAGIPETPTVSVRALWITHAGVSRKLIRNITLALWSENNRAALDAGHPKGRDVQLKTALDGIPIPLHRGARDAYEQLGVDIPDGY